MVTIKVIVRHRSASFALFQWWQQRVLLRPCLLCQEESVSAKKPKIAGEYD
jgi:hypothetical protein